MVALVIILYIGFSYYNVKVEERFFHPDHLKLKPSGVLGHGLGIVGSLLMIIGVFTYMARKRYRSLTRIGILKHWLEFHIFLCTLGPILVLFHTAFKFGGHRRHKFLEHGCCFPERNHRTVHLYPDSEDN